MLGSRAESSPRRLDDNVPRQAPSLPRMMWRPKCPGLPLARRRTPVQKLKEWDSMGPIRTLLRLLLSPSLCAVASWDSELSREKSRSRHLKTWAGMSRIRLSLPALTNQRNSSRSTARQMRSYDLPARRLLKPRARNDIGPSHWSASTSRTEKLSSPRKTSTTSSSGNKRTRSLQAKPKLRKIDLNTRRRD
jgi:hypothetical protein